MRKYEVFAGLSFLCVVVVHIAYITLEFCGIAYTAGFFDFLMESYIFPYYAVALIIVVLFLINIIKNRNK